MQSNPSLQADQPYVKRDLKNKTLPVDARGEGASQSWLDMRFRMQSKFTVSDRLSVVTRFDALDGKKYGQDDNDYKGCKEWNGAKNVKVECGRNSNIDFDRAYMVIKADFGTFKVGRMGGEAYGNDFLDAGTERDRIDFTTSLDKWSVSAIYEKQAENDADDCDGLDVLTDSDMDSYYLGATYKSEDLAGGVMLDYSFDKSGSDDTGFSAAAAGAGDLVYDTSIFDINPFIDASFGDFGVNAEALLRFGKYAEFDRDIYKAAINAADVYRKGLGLGPQPDVDYDAYAWNIEGTWASGPFSAQLGYVWAKGEDDPFDDKYESVGGVGADWGKVFILTNTDSGFEGSLGGHGRRRRCQRRTRQPGRRRQLRRTTNGCKMFYNRRFLFSPGQSENFRSVRQLQGRISGLRGL